MQMLTNELVEMRIVDEITGETISRMLRKCAHQTVGEKQWCIIEVSTQFVWRIENVL